MLNHTFFSNSKPPHSKIFKASLLPLIVCWIAGIMFPCTGCLEPGFCSYNQGSPNYQGVKNICHPAGVQLFMEGVFGGSLLNLFKTEIDRFLAINRIVGYGVSVEKWPLG